MKIKHCRTAALVPKVGLFILKFEHILIERIAGIVEERTGKDRTQPGLSPRSERSRGAEHTIKYVSTETRNNAGISPIMRALPHFTTTQ